MAMVVVVRRVVMLGVCMQQSYVRKSVRVVKIRSRRVVVTNQLFMLMRLLVKKLCELGVCNGLLHNKTRLDNKINFVFA